MCGMGGARSSYWMERAKREEEQAGKSSSRGQIAFHRDQARRFLDLAFADARLTQRA